VLGLLDEELFGEDDVTAVTDSMTDSDDDSNKDSWEDDMLEDGNKPRPPPDKLMFNGQGTSVFGNNIEGRDVTQHNKQT